MGPGFGVTHILPRIVSPQVASQLLLVRFDYFGLRCQRAQTGTHVTGIEAAAIGLVLAALPKAQVLEASLGAPHSSCLALMTAN